jgi:hypothetical protein
LGNWRRSANRHVYGPPGIQISPKPGTPQRNLTEKIAAGI